MLACSLQNMVVKMILVNNRQRERYFVKFIFHFLFIIMNTVQLGKASDTKINF